MEPNLYHQTKRKTDKSPRVQRGARLLNKLHNRRGINNLLQTSIAYRSLFELMFVDLDGFKLVNDTMGIA
ncbi:diguanylate cyclase [Vibrio chagasii]|nr:diguanylate cyclase [Vibrio chagasii]